MDQPEQKPAIWTGKPGLDMDIEHAELGQFVKAKEHGVNSGGFQVKVNNLDLILPAGQVGGND